MPVKVGSCSSLRLVVRPSFGLKMAFFLIKDLILVTYSNPAKIDFNVDLTQKLCGALLLPHIRCFSGHFNSRSIVSNSTLTEIFFYCCLGNLPIPSRRLLRGTALYFCKSLFFTPKFTYLCLCCCVCSARLSIKHPNLFGRNEKLEVLWNKGLDDSNILIAFRRPRPDWTSQQSFTIQVDVSCFKPFGVLNNIF